MTIKVVSLNGMLLILAIGLDLVSNRVSEIKIAESPCFAVETIKFNEIMERADLKLKVESIEKKADFGKYTVYYVDSNKVSKRYYNVMLTTKTKRGRMFFITDGISSPKWRTTDEIQEAVLYDGIKLSNAKIGYNDDGVRCIMSRKGIIPDTDYIDHIKNYKNKLRSIKNRDRS